MQQWVPKAHSSGEADAGECSAGATGKRVMRNRSARARETTCQQDESLWNVYHGTLESSWSQAGGTEAPPLGDDCDLDERLCLGREGPAFQAGASTWRHVQGKHGTWKHAVWFYQAWVEGTAFKGGLSGVTACFSCCTIEHGLELLAKQGVSMVFILFLV